MYKIYEFSLVSFSMYKIYEFSLVSFSVEQFSSNFDRLANGLQLPLRLHTATDAVDAIN